MDGNHIVTFVRHAQSQWNLENRFTGWQDVPLSAAGLDEARRAGRLLGARGFRFDIAFTSPLQRAVTTLKVMLEEMKHPEIPVVSSWRINERQYGGLEGLNKTEVAQKYGAEQQNLWRRGYRERPPALAIDDPRHPSHSPLYAGVDPAVLPATESLEDAYHRVVAYWHEGIEPEIRAGKRILMASHGNTLRALIKYLDGVSDEAVQHIEVPTGQPLVYEFDGGLKPSRHYYVDGAANGGGAAKAAMSARSL